MSRYDVVHRSDFDVDLIVCEGSDQFICKAARVSTLGAGSINTDESAGLINFLLKNRHGTPFEHNFLNFRISAPIFVWREFMRHRIGFSYNEESGRYKRLEPVFYIPPGNRMLVQEGKPGAYTFVEGSQLQDQTVVGSLGFSYEKAWEAYELMLERGIAKEVARMCLPVGIYSTAYVSCNARSLMSFLSLRTKDVDSKFPSYPQWEIEQVAKAMENSFALNFPLTHNAFQESGRVAP